MKKNVFDQVNNRPQDDITLPPPAGPTVCLFPLFQPLVLPFTDQYTIFILEKWVIFSHFKK